MKLSRSAALLCAIAVQAALVAETPSAPAAPPQPATTAAPAPTAATPTTPSEPHERMAFFIGRWTIVEFPAEGGFLETCDWLGSGRRHVVCRSNWMAKSGPREGLSVFSYRSADSTYAYQGFRPSGGTQTLTGRVSSDGKLWEFDGDEGAGESRLRTRVRIRPNADGSFRFTEQTATGTGDWSAEEVVTYRAAPAARQ
jgi:hypothetical protein